MKTFILLAYIGLFSFKSNGLTLVQQCNACHRNYPKLAHQHKSYFIKQIEDIKQHRLQCPAEMAEQIGKLNEKDIEDLAIYYAKLPISQSRCKTIRSNSLGQKLYTTGDYSRQIPGCRVCHGPKGEGNAQAGFPLLAGQSSQYIIEQLNNFKNSKRTNDLNQIMQSICSKMNQEDIKALALYIEQL